MKILLVSYYPLPYVGGLWKVISNIKYELIKRGHQVDILAQTPDTTSYRILDHPSSAGISSLDTVVQSPIETAYPNLKHKKWIYNTEVFRHTLEIAALYYGLGDYDVIHAQDVIAAASIARVKPKKTPLITSTHGYLTKEIYFVLQNIYPNSSADELYGSFEYQYHEALEYTGCQLSDIIQTQSRWIRDNIQKQHHLPDEKFITYPYGMDINKFEQLPIQADLVPVKTKPVLLFVGRLVQLKGVETLLDALRSLLEQTSDWECWMLGDGFEEDIERYLDQINELGLEHHVRLLGSVTNVKDFLSAADIFVLPSLQDTQPHSVMEAQLSSVPVIVSDAAGLPEMVEDKKTGLISKAGDARDLSKNLFTLLSDRNLRNAIIQETKLWALQQWSLDNMITHTETMYRTIINQK